MNIPLAFYFNKRIGPSDNQSVVCLVGHGSWCNCGLKRAAGRRKCSPFLPCEVCKQVLLRVASSPHFLQPLPPSQTVEATSDPHACLRLLCTKM